MHLFLSLALCGDHQFGNEITKVLFVREMMKHFEVTYLLLSDSQRVHQFSLTFACDGYLAKHFLQTHVKPPLDRMDRQGK